MMAADIQEFGKTVRAFSQLQLFAIQEYSSFSLTEEMPRTSN